jgi:hypothetical protein
MEIKNIHFKGNEITVHKFDDSDLSDILKPLIIWYNAATISQEYGLRTPPIPEEFTEKFASYVSGYYHKDNDGPDAFDLNNDGIIPIEIKSTTTSNGFQGAITIDNFEKLLWFDFSQWKEFRFRIYEYPKEVFINQKKRFSLQKIARDNNIGVKYSGAIAINSDDLNLDALRNLIMRQIHNLDSMIREGRNIIHFEKNNTTICSNN